MTSQQPETFSVIGAGRVATALSLALVAAGRRPRLVVNRTLEAADVLAARLEASESSRLGDLGHLPGSLIVISVSDDALSGVVDRLTKLEENWRHRTIFHTSGTESSDLLGYFADHGATVGSFHPVQTFAVSLDDHDQVPFNGVPVAIEGAPAALRTMSRICDELGAVAIELSSESKTLFHAGAVVASNYLVTLQTLAERLFRTAVGTADSTPQPYALLARTALANVQKMGSTEALTGPVVRGDIKLVEKHLSAIRQRLPEILPVYAELGKETVRLAAVSGKLGSTEAADLMTLFDRFHPKD